MHKLVLKDIRLRSKPEKSRKSWGRIITSVFLSSSTRLKLPLSQQIWLSVSATGFYYLHVEQFIIMQ